MKFILASSSPRRREMIKNLGLECSVRSPDIDESEKKGESPARYVQRLAREKALSVAEQMRGEGEKKFAVLSADTTVVLGNKILGKPRDEKEALKMLKNISGKTHEVLTSFCWIIEDSSQRKIIVKMDRTKVSIARRPEKFWKWYITTGEPMDKAGSYAAQGIGMSFIENISGSYSNVVGLPLSNVMKTLEEKAGSRIYKEIFDVR